VAATRLPYTTLFRSARFHHPLIVRTGQIRPVKTHKRRLAHEAALARWCRIIAKVLGVERCDTIARFLPTCSARCAAHNCCQSIRSEEHTSELQSREH